MFYNLYCLRITEDYFSISLMTDQGMDEAMKLVAKRLKQARLDAGLTQLELSFQSGVSQGMITYIEQGERNPAFKTILKLCDALHIRFSDLLEGIEPETNEGDTAHISRVKKEMGAHLKELERIVSKL